MSSEDREDREVISETERIELKRSGGSDSLRVPANWRRSFRQLKGSLVFDAHIERARGKILLVFEKVEE